MGTALRTVFFVDGFGVREGVPTGLLGAPFVIDEDGQPDDRLIDYLWTRRNGDWTPKTPVAGSVVEANGQNVVRASSLYLKNRVYQLNVFRRWLRAEGLDYSEVNELVLDRFAEELEEGLSDDVPGLLPSSVNQYLTSAIELLNFGAMRNWRPKLLLRTAAIPWQRRTGRSSARRLIVMRRVNPAEISTWYTEEQVEAFIREFETAPAVLAARIMHRMGLRIFETLALELDTLPTLERYRRDPAARTVKIKGKFGKWRHVPVDEEIIRAVERFKTIGRNRYEKRLSEPTNLLLIADTVAGSAAPMKARYLQKQFARARAAAGFSALSPHILRHHFAAHFLLRAWNKKAAIFGQAAGAFDVSGATSLLSVELLDLQKALGHSSFDTTTRYLNGVAYLLGSGLPGRFSDELDGEAL